MKHPRYNHGKIRHGNGHLLREQQRKICEKSGRQPGISNRTSTLKLPISFKKKGRGDSYKPLKPSPGYGCENNQWNRIYNNIELKPANNQPQVADNMFINIFEECSHLSYLWKHHVQLFYVALDYHQGNITVSFAN